MQIHELQRENPNKKAKRVGRGGSRGKTSGRGTKGQKARAGHRLRPEMRDIIKKLPKRRGYGKNRSRGVVGDRIAPSVVNLKDLKTLQGNEVSPETLAAAGIVNRRAGSLPEVKILGVGSISQAYTVKHCTVSESAKGKIEAAGGSIVAKG